MDGDRFTLTPPCAAPAFGLGQSFHFEAAREALHLVRIGAAVVLGRIDSRRRSATTVLSNCPGAQRVERRRLPPATGAHIPHAKSRRV